MEPALRSFLDGIDENDNVVTLHAPPKQAPKNDNEEPVQDGSGMLDMRELAKRYRQMVDGSAAKQVEAAPPVSVTAFSNHILAPVVEAPSERHPALLIASIAMGAVMLVGLTVVITVVMLRGSVNSVETPALLATASEQADLAEPLAVDELPAAQLPAAQELAELQPEMVFEVEEELESATLHEKAPVQAPVAAAPVAKETISPKPAQSTQPVSQPSKPSAAPPEAVAASAKTTVPVVANSKAIVESADVSAAGCDEVACLLEGRACCGKGAAAPKVAAPSVDESRPTKLSRSDISEGLAPVQGRLQSCGTRNAVTGAVTLKLKINAEGEVLASTMTTGSDAFQSCVSQILLKAQFAQTRAGTTLSYPIILR